jgi:diphthamide biosynthesis enzyme Dph1/Dph2-like protein
MEEIADIFDLVKICEVIKAKEFKRVVLQFPDENLEYSVDVYEYMLMSLNNGNIDNDIDNVNDDNGNSGIDVFISADSTYGSSVDDVSADHVDAQILIYFGSDLSSSGTMPVLVAPRRIKLNIEHTTESIFNALNSTISEIGDGKGDDCVPSNVNVLVLYEPGCYNDVEVVTKNLKLRYDESNNENKKEKVAIVMGTLPNVASMDIDTWSKNKNNNNDNGDGDDTLTNLGGLVVSNDFIKEQDQNPSNSVSTFLIYIGNKEIQLQSISLQLSLYTIIHYNPNPNPTIKLNEDKDEDEDDDNNYITYIKGENTIKFRERYGGISKIKNNCNIIGIIVGSMGLTDNSTKMIINRLQNLIKCANKSYYTLIMGKLREVKCSEVKCSSALYGV